MARDPNEIRKDIENAREIAASIRLRYSRGYAQDPDTRKAATLLLTLADELERARPELRPDEGDE